ncbi:hypothetical protein BD410DRAFT_845152 [Rickenella mellea]|uniref:Uncharacterized protein n=1 Tax=Rickenella mellea TaxID=50990 RepID=A0A4Y7PL02_9AGAM|nr:hypothetical protein BD410DRAFT_845152 [Rickenella mellea]
MKAFISAAISLNFLQYRRRGRPVEIDHAIVKQKKMAELGLAMGNDAMGGMEEMHYALGPDGQYHPVMPQPHELGHDQPFPQG